MTQYWFGSLLGFRIGICDANKAVRDKSGLDKETGKLLDGD